MRPVGAGGRPCPSSLVQVAAAVGRLVQPVVVAAAGERPRQPAKLPDAGVEHVRILRVHRQVGRAAARAGVQRLLPGLAAVVGHVHAAVGAVGEDVAERGDDDVVVIARIDDDPARCTSSLAGRRWSSARRRRSSCTRRRRSSRRCADSSRRFQPKPSGCRLDRWRPRRWRKRVPSSKTGSQVCPLLTDFQTPPPALPK